VSDSYLTSDKIDLVGEKAALVSNFTEKPWEVRCSTNATIKRGGTFF